MNILWHSNAPWAPTGYGTQTAQVVPKLRELGHNVAISAFFGLEGGVTEWDGIRTYPGDDTGFGKRTLGLWARDFAGTTDDCLVMTLMDVWALGAPAVRGLNTACWVPVDHDPVPPRVTAFFEDSGARPIAMSRFGERALREVGLDPLYVPHAIDTKLFAPVADRAGLRRALKIPEDAFVIGVVANNQGSSPPRKAFPQIFHAFAAFRNEHPNAFLYLHAEMAGIRHGVNLAALAGIHGIPEEAIGVTDQNKLTLGIPDETMPLLYSAFDVLANPSYGEGFGIPIIEAQACGTPVIVTDWTAMPELCGAGWKVAGDPWYDCSHGSFYKCPSLADLYDAFGSAYKDAAGMREQARAFALGYDADKVFETYWKPVLDELGAPREVGPLEVKREELHAVA